MLADLSRWSRARSLALRPLADMDLSSNEPRRWEVVADLSEVDPVDAMEVLEDVAAVLPGRLDLELAGGFQVGLCICT